MKWTEFKKKFLELCDFNNMSINDVNVVKNDDVAPIELRADDEIGEIWIFTS